MDSFEQVIASILERNGFWTRTSVKVDLTPEDKQAIGRTSSPRWELDVVAYQGRKNLLRVIECKSYLDSYGVRAATFAGKNQKDETHYKLFFDDNLRKVVLERLVAQLVKQGFCRANPKVKFGLAAGKVYGEIPGLQRHFDERDWLLWTPQKISSELKALKDSKYENSVAAVVAKLILRGVVDNATRNPD
jgi:hypothetical protein